MSSEYAKWRRLSNVERRAALEAAAGSAVVTARLLLRPARSRPDDFYTRPRRSRVDEITPHRLARLVSAVTTKLPWKMNCLRSSLVLARMLQRRGLEPSVRLGVQQSESALLFHAWVELDGEVLNDRTDVAEVFSPFGPDLPPPGAQIA